MRIIKKFMKVIVVALLGVVAGVIGCALLSFGYGVCSVVGHVLVHLTNISYCCHTENTFAAVGFIAFMSLSSIINYFWYR